MTQKPQDPARLLEGELTGAIISASYECYNVLGSGFLESVYRRVLATGLRTRGHRCAEEGLIEVR